jgi:hypothetical protein
VIPFERSAPLLHSSEEPLTNVEPSRGRPVRDPTAYDRAVKARKRRNWLSWLDSVASSALGGSERQEAWEAIAEASKAETREATPKRARQLLDALDKRFRAERTRRPQGKKTPMKTIRATGWPWG